MLGFLLEAVNTGSIIAPPFFMSVGGCSDFGQGAELVGFGLLLSASFVERDFLGGLVIGGVS